MLFHKFWSQNCFQWKEKMLIQTVKIFLQLLKYDSDEYKSKQMCGKGALEEPSALYTVPKRIKTQKNCKKVIKK